MQFPQEVKQKMQHSEYQIVIPAATAVMVAGDSPSRSSLRFKNASTTTLYIGNGPGVDAGNGYLLMPSVSDGPHELHLAYPWGDDTTQAYYAFNASAQDVGVICVMEHCCPRLHLPQELEEGIQ